MAICSIVKMGTPTLFSPSKAVDRFGTPELYILIQDMLDTMRHAKGVGIAAPQIGCNQRIIIFGFEANPRYPNEAPVPLTILINPQIIPLTDEKVDDWEGCLSVPGLRGRVPRYQRICYTGFDPKGNPIKREVENFHARIVQHESDHIDGILFPQRVTDMQHFGYEDVLWERIMQEKTAAT